MTGKGQRGGVSLLGAARLAFILTVLTVLQPCVAAGQEEFDLKIPASPVADAIKSLSFQTGHSVLFQTDDVKAVATNAIEGRMTLRDALDALLEGTTLSGGLTESGVVTISLSGDHNAGSREGEMASGKIKKSLLVSVSTLLFGTGAAYAQSQAENPETEAKDVVVVVGSRIAGPSLAGVLPVTVIGEDEIIATGAVSGEELFQNIPQMGDVTFNQTSGQVSSNFARGDIGSVDLRNLGVGSTLVLINGRRGVNYPSSQASGNLAPVLTFNSNTVPVNGVRRVEVLRDGAGAIYGSDAVAGVVNMVLRDDYDGARIDAQYGNAPGTNMREFNVNGLFGKNFADGRGNVTLFANYTDRTALRATDQEFSASGDLRPLFVGTDFEGDTQLVNDSTTTPWGVFGTVGGVPVFQGATRVTSAGGLFHVQPSTNAGCLADLGGEICIDDANPATGATGADANLRWDARNNYPVSLQPDLERLNLFAMGKYQINDAIELFGEGGYYRATTASVQDSVFSIGSIRMTVPASNYWNPFGPVTFADGSPNPNRLPGIDAPAEGLPVTINTLRFTDLGPTTVRVTAEQYRALAGLRGEAYGLSWETAVLYSEASVDDRQLGVDSTALQANLAMSTPEAFNPFNGGDPLNPGSDSTFSSQAGIDSFSFISNRRNKATLFQWDASVSRPDLLTMWAGDVGFAAGLEFRRETQLDDRDPNVDGTNVWIDTVLGVTQESNLYGVSPTPDNFGARKVTSAYVEAAVPFVSPEMGVPLVQSFNLQLAGRFEHYSDIGSVAKPKVAFAWDVFDGLRFRGAYSQGFRAPNLEQVNASLVTRGNGRTDWVRCEARLRKGLITSFDGDCDGYTAVVTDRRAGNPDLQAEQSENWTAGVVLQPHFLSEAVGDITVTVDYWNIQQEGIVGVFGSDNASALDYLLRVQGMTNPNISRRDPTADDIALYDGTGLAPAGELLFNEDQYRNLQPQKAEGIDVSMAWNADTAIGDFSGRFNASRILKFERGVLDGVGELIAAREAGIINAGTDLPDAEDLIQQDGNPKWRLSSSLTWTLNQFRLGASATYVGKYIDTSLVNDVTGDEFIADSHTVVNLYGQYSFSGGLVGDGHIRVGVRNLFDNQPPLADETFGYRGSLASPIGRYLYVNVSKEF